MGSHISFLVVSLEKMGRKTELSSDSVVLDFWQSSPDSSDISAVSTWCTDSKQRTRRLKVLYWDHKGVCSWHKRPGRDFERETLTFKIEPLVLLQNFNANDARAIKRRYLIPIRRQGFAGASGRTGRPG
jgi:hypothetical protein